jgi:hypothetical protein
LLSIEKGIALGLNSAFSRPSPPIWSTNVTPANSTGQNLAFF